jgi:5' nucleotidase family
MNYLEGKKSGEEKDMEWAKYFDVIIVGGNKPSFLEDERYVTHRTVRILY